MQVKPLLGALVGGAFLLLGGALQAQTVAVEQASCVPQEDNGIVRASVNGSGPTLQPRLYFRWNDHEDFYWVAMEAEPNGRFWATPPKPEMRNEMIQYYGALVDASGKVVARSQMLSTRVTKDCKPQLTPKERGVAENLTVGETTPKQQGRKVLAFLCDGVITRINYAGIRRADDVCRACVVAFWPRVISPAVAGLTSIVVIGDDPEPSPARP